MCNREAAATKREELKRAEEELMEARRQELLNEEDGYWRQRMDQQQLVEKLKAEVAEQEELKGHSEVSALAALTFESVPAELMSNSMKSALTSGCAPIASYGTACLLCSAQTASLLQLPPKIGVSQLAHFSMIGLHPIVRHTIASEQ